MEINQSQSTKHEYLLYALPSVPSLLAAEVEELAETAWISVRWLWAYHTPCIFPSGGSPTFCDTLSLGCKLLVESSCLPVCFCFRSSLQIYTHKFEHPTRVDKIVPSLLCWDVLMSPVLLLINDIQNTYYIHSSWSILNETYPTLAASNSAKGSESSGMDELTLVPRWSSYLHISIGMHRLTCAVQVGSQHDTRACIALHCLHIDTCRNATQGWTRILSLTTSVLHSYIWSWKAHNFINIFVFYKLDAT